MFRSLVVLGVMVLLLNGGLSGEPVSRDQIEVRILQLEDELQKLKAERAQLIRKEESGEFENEAVNAVDTPSGPARVENGEWTVGGAIRANYTIGDYPSGDRPSRGGHGGNFELDVFRLNVDYQKAALGGKMEYRFYDGYNFMHTLYGSYSFEDDSVLKVGLNRVPFGVGPYGPANSWFFDQHYYVGLADDMDYGVYYSKTVDSWTYDMAFYVSAENNWQGASADSARYSYDIVDTGAPNGHYQERGQINLRAVRSVEGSYPYKTGVSMQLGRLEGDGVFADDTYAYAFAVHSEHSWNDWGLKAQVTYYNYNADYTGLDESNNDLILMGAYDYAAAVAGEAIIPSVAINYLWKPDQISWIDSINFYNDFSIILKQGTLDTGESFNDSALNVLGMAIARGGWYVYVDLALSNGNYFVGDSGDFGANLGDDWQKRFNINFGYYF